MHEIHRRSIQLLRGQAVHVLCENGQDQSKMASRAGDGAATLDALSKSAALSSKRDVPVFTSKYCATVMQAAIERTLS
jgi:hypothetical protein